jgi:hypothetical protein
MCSRRRGPRSRVGCCQAERCGPGKVEPRVSRPTAENKDHDYDDSDLPQASRTHGCTTPPDDERFPSGRCTQTADEAQKMLPMVEVAVSREDLG